MTSPASPQDENVTGYILIGIFTLLFTLVAKFVAPTWFHMPHPNRASEAKLYLGSMNRAQQAYYVEHKFLTTHLEALELGITSETNSYLYRLETLGELAIQHVAIAIQQSTSWVHTQP